MICTGSTLYLILHLSRGCPLDLFMRERRGNAVGDADTFDPHFTLMTLRLKQQRDADALRVRGGAFERAVMHLYQTHLSGAGISARGWKTLGTSHYLALKFVLDDPEVITRFRIGVYRILEELLTDGGGCPPAGSWQSTPLNLLCCLPHSARKC